jgi:RsiW-degrading membrane proteinase PrsW (M82 family)
MTSPFKTFKEFSEAEGPIYTFANNPSAIAVLLIVVAGITIYFLYASYNIKPGETKPQNPVALSLFLIAGVSSLLASSFLSND